MKHHQICLYRGFYSSPLKFPMSTSVYPLGKRTPVSHGRGFSTGLGVAVLLIVFVAIFFAHSSHCHADDTKKDDSKWTLMFDGKTLDGWSPSRLEKDKKAEIKGGYIVIGRDDLASGLKYDKPFPKSNYKIMYQAKRAKGYDFFGTLTFPVKESHCSFITGGWGGYLIGLSSIGGYDASENETSGFYDFKENQWYQFRVCVSDDRITVWIDPLDKDGKIIETAKGGIEKPKVDLVLEDKSVSTRLEVTFFQPLGISTWNTEGHIRDIKYRELTPDEVEQIKLLTERPRTN